MPQYATRIGQAVRKLARGRIEKDAHGLLRLRAENDHTRKQLLRLARHSVNVQNTVRARSEEHTSELQSRRDLVCRLLLEKKKTSSTCSTNPFPTPSETP